MDCNTGDCIVKMRDLEPGSVDLVFADPPFNIGYDYGGEYDDRRTIEEYARWSKSWIYQVHRILKPRGTFWLAIGDEWAADLRIFAREQGFFLRSWVVWYFTFGVNSPKKLTRSHTHLFYFTKHRTRFTFNEKSIRVPSARALVYNDKRANPDGRLPDDTWILRPQEAPDSFQADHDTWHFPRIAGTFKRRQAGAANQMPEQLLGRVIRACSNPGDLVFDPFVGTGTTLAVAKKLGRRYLGYEISSTFAKAARKRITAAKEGDPLDAPLRDENP
jgi:site-specific DNA-methyltransferase (adenine-specific)